MITASEVLNFIKYQLFSKTKFDVHSPFVYDLIVNVLEDKRYFYAYGEIETLKKQLLRDSRRLEITDLGAGSKLTGSKIKPISEIAKNSSKSKRLGRLLFRIAAYYKPDSILELGTSLGLSTLYLHKGRSGARIITIEGCNEIAKIAQENFNILNADKIELRTGSFEEQLLPTLRDLGKADLIFIDGNHRYRPTIDYFNAILPFVHNDTILIFDDINWSAEMQKAWKEIISHPDITVIVDLYYFGMIFFRKEQTKQYFSVLY